MNMEVNELLKQLSYVSHLMANFMLSKFHCIHLSARGFYCHNIRLKAFLDTLVCLELPLYAADISFKRAVNITFRTGPPEEPAGVFIENVLSINNSAQVVWTWNPAANHGFQVMFFHVEAMTEVSPEWRYIATGLYRVDNFERRFLLVDAKIRVVG